MKILIEVNCNSGVWKNNKLLPLEEVKKFLYAPAAQTLRFVGFSCKKVIFSVLLTSDKKIQKLNFEHRGKKSSTNVLSFSYLEEHVLKNLTLP